MNDLLGKVYAVPMIQACTKIIFTGPSKSFAGQTSAVFVREITV